MGSLLSLLLFLLLTIFLALKTSNFILSPQIGYLLGFILQAVFCLFYIDQWNIKLHPRTILTIVGGGILFWIISFAVQDISKKISTNNIQNTLKKQNYIEVEFFKLFLFVIFQTVVLLGYVHFMNANMNGLGLAAKIYDYRSRTADYGEIIKIPKVLSFGRLLSSAIGYVLSLICVFNLLNKTLKYKFLFTLNIILSILLEGILGARGGIFNFIVAIFAEFLIIRYICFGKNISLKVLFKIFFAGCGLILLLPIAGKMMGRPNMGLIYEIAVYVGAPLKNLDIFLRDPTNYTSTHFSTLYGLLNDLQRWIPYGTWIATQRFRGKWQFIDGKTLGNVYTTYANYWYDAGPIGVIIYTTLMAFLSQMLFQMALNGKKHSMAMSIVLIILYVYFFSAIVFSFFTNKFLNQMFSLYSIKFIIAIMTMTFVTINIRLSINGKKIS